MSVAEINKLLEPHLFQVIGSTPKSVMNSIKKVELRGKAKEGAYLLSVAVFASAVNKPTMESYLAKPEFANIRPLINVALSIQGKANMTAFTLLGHCIMTTHIAKEILFTNEFRAKLGQDHIWAGNLESGSLSEKQKNILKEKKRQISESDAKLLGSGYLKWVGLDTAAMSTDESLFWDLTTEESIQPSSSYARPVATTPPRTIPRPERRQAAAGVQADVPFNAVSGAIYNIPADVMHYRRNILRQTDADISDSINRNGIDGFIQNTRSLIAADPDGRRAQMATAV